MRLLSSPRRRRRLLWWGGSLAAVALFVGVGVVTLDRGVQEEPLSNEPAQIVAQPDQTELSGSAREQAIDVAARWIDTAVARKHVERSWALTHPQLRSGYTRESWANGDIPVVPYPVVTARWRFDYSYPNQVGFKVALFPKDGSDLEPVVFDIDLRATGTGAQRRWLVDEWAPSGGTGADTRLTSKKAVRARAAAADKLARKEPKGRLGARWLLLPPSIIFGVALIVLGSVLVTSTLRSRRARREWRRHREQASSGP